MQPKGGSPERRLRPAHCAPGRKCLPQPQRTSLKPCPEFWRKIDRKRSAPGTTALVLWGLEVRRPGRRNAWAGRARHAGSGMLPWLLTWLSRTRWGTRR